MFMQKRKNGRNEMAEILDGLPLREKIKYRYLNVMSRIRLFLDKHPQYMKFVETYLFSGLMMGIFCYIIMSIWMSQSIIRFISTFIATTIGLVYIEHYWYWFKVKYKDYELEK